MEKQCIKHNTKMTPIGVGNFQLHICTLCEQEKQIIRQQEEQINKQKQIKELVTQLIQQANIPKRFQYASFDNYQSVTTQAAKNKSILLEYSNNIDNTKDNPSPILLGTTGTGKTHLVIATIKHIIQHKHINAYYTTAYQLQEQHKTYQLLVIDELTQDNTDTKLTKHIIDYRYLNMLPTIIVSNHTLQQLQNILTIPIIERLFTPNKLILTFTWNSYRST